MNQQRVVVLITIMPVLESVKSNDTAFGYSKSFPAPIEQKHIQMVRGSIILQGYTLKINQTQDEWYYHCRYIFINTSKQTQHLTTGFPFLVYEHEEGVAILAEKKIFKGSALVYHLTTTVNRKTIKVGHSKIAPNSQKSLNYKDTYLWSITVELMTGVTYTSTQIFSENEKIASLKMQSRPKGLKIQGRGKNREYICELKDFHPTEDLDLCLQTRKHFVEYQIVNKILSDATKYPKLQKYFDHQ